MALDPIDSYHEALREFPGSTVAIEHGLERFATAFGDLTHRDLDQRMASLYAERIFFNDTIHTFANRQDLVDYMTRTGAGLSESTVDIQQVLQDGPDVFVRWTMEFHTQAMGRSVHSRSIGMTHLRFDESGQIVVHQDFWDSGHGLYAHLPFVGFAIRQAHRRM